MTARRRPVNYAASFRPVYAAVSFAVLVLAQPLGAERATQFGAATVRPNAKALGPPMAVPHHRLRLAPARPLPETRDLTVSAHL